MRSLIATGLLVCALAPACGVEAPPPRDWRERPFEALADDTGAIYALVIEVGLRELAEISGASFHPDPLDVRPVLAEQGRPPLPPDVREAIRSHIDRNVRFHDPLQTGLPDGVAVFFSPIVLRGTERHVTASFVSSTPGEYSATFILEPRWRLKELKDEQRLCAKCPEFRGAKPQP